MHRHAIHITYSTYIADISVHNLRLGILHFLFHFLALLCFVYYFWLLFMKSHKYLSATRAVFPRSPRPLPLSPSQFDISICYKFKIIIDQKATTYDSLLKWISHTKIQSVNSRTEARKGQLTQADLWPALTLCAPRILICMWSGRWSGRVWL